MKIKSLWHKFRAAQFRRLAERTRISLLMVVETETSRERKFLALADWHAEMAAKPAATMPSNREILPTATFSHPKQCGDSGRANKTRIRAILRAIPKPERRAA